MPKNISKFVQESLKSLSIKEIAIELGISEWAVVSYIPYGKRKKKGPNGPL